MAASVASSWGPVFQARSPRSVLFSGRRAKPERVRRPGRQVADVRLVAEVPNVIRESVGSAERAPLRRAPIRTAPVRPTLARTAPLRPAPARRTPGARVVRPTSRSGAAALSRTARPAARRLRLTRRGRVIAVVLVLAAVYAAFGLGRASAGSEAVPQHAHAVTVQPGDSLWSIAVRTMPKSDPRDAVAQLKSLNHLSSSSVVVGEQLQLP